MKTNAHGAIVLMALVGATGSLPALAQNTGTGESVNEQALADEGQVDASPADDTQQADNAGRPTPGAADERSVCAELGEGYSPISGTDTCLRVGGYVRVDAGAGDLNGLDLDGASGEEPDGDADAWNTNARFALKTYTSTDTAHGKFSTFSEIRFNYGNALAESDFTGLAVQDSSSEISVNFAWIELGGIRVGKSETLFDTFTGYGGAVINDATVGGYGPFDTNLISYTWRGGNGLQGAVSLEQGAEDWLADSYLPHIVLAGGLETDGTRLRGSLAVDTRDDDDDAREGGVTLKLRADRPLGDTADVFAMLLFGENSSGYTTWRTGEDDEETASIITGHSLAHFESLSSNSQLQWVQSNGGDTVVNAVLNLAWNVVPGLTLTPEIQWLRDNEGGSGFGAILRAQASF